MLKRTRLGALGLGLLVVAEFSTGLSHSLAGDDFELLSLARIGGFSPSALFIPHRAVFLKPVMNAAWAALAMAFGAHAAAWHAFALALHLLNALLLGILAARLCTAFRSGPCGVTGLAAAGIWAVHDRLAEPLFSIASLNHSLTLALYLGALVAILFVLARSAAGPSPAEASARGSKDGRERQTPSGDARVLEPPARISVPDTRSQSERTGDTGLHERPSRISVPGFLAVMLFLLALLGYEVAASLIPVAALVMLMTVQARKTHPGSRPRSSEHETGSTGPEASDPGLSAAQRSGPSLAASSAGATDGSARGTRAGPDAPDALDIQAAHAREAPDARAAALRRWTLSAPLASLAARVHEVRAASAGLVFWLGLAAAGYAALQAAARSAPGGVSYYRFSPALAARNLSEIPLSFLHIRSDWIAPGPWLAALVAGLLALGFVLIRDRVARFGLGWFLCAYLPLAPIPEFSDRYHYIAFAGLALAAARGIALLATRGSPDADPAPRSRLPAGTAPFSDGAGGGSTRTFGGDRARPPARALAAFLLLAHVVWSFGGAREQAAYFGFKGTLPDLLLRDVRGIVAAPSSPKPPESAAPSQPDDTIWALVWRDDPTFSARMMMDIESRSLPHWFGERGHPVFVRPDAILGAVYPLDLLHVAAAARGGFYRTPAPSRCARAIAGMTLRIQLLARRSWVAGSRRDDLESQIAARLAQGLLARREIPRVLPPAGDAFPVPLRIAYVEATSRAAAFEAEFGR